MNPTGQERPSVQRSALRPPQGGTGHDPHTRTDLHGGFLSVLVGSCASAAGAVAAGGVRPAGDQFPRRFSRLPEGGPGARGSANGVVQRFALRRVGEDSCPSTAGVSLCRAVAARSSAEGCLRPERAAAVGGGRTTMYEDVPGRPGRPGRPRGSYATVMTTLPRACPCSTRRRPSAVSASGYVRSRTGVSFPASMRPVRKASGSDTRFRTTASRSPRTCPPRGAGMAMASTSSCRRGYGPKAPRH